jgi:hypothetical protein
MQFPTLTGGMKGGEKNMESNSVMILRLMKEAFDALKDEASSRELSLVKTKLEEAMMWFNKDRTIKGELTPTATHVQ